MEINSESLANLIKAVESGKKLNPEEKKALAEMAKMAEISEKTKISEKPSTQPVKETDSKAADLFSGDRVVSKTINANIDESAKIVGDSGTSEVLQLLQALQEAQVYNNQSKSSSPAAELTDSLTK